MDISPELPFSKAFDYASGVTADRFTNPLWRVTELFTGFKFKSSLAEVKRFGSKIVMSAQKRQLNKDKSLRINLIDSFLDHISDPQTVADAAVNFLSAGRDTTAQTLTWTIYSLLRNPLHHKSLVQSLRDNFKGHARDSVPPLNYEMISGQHSLPWVQAVFAEALRLNPAVPIELKETTKSVTLPDGTYLPSGAVVIWIPFSLARSPNIWGSDAPEFNPKRWLDEQSDGNIHMLTRTAFENPVFNAGPRMCLGKRMAELLAVRVLAEVMWLWEFEEVRGSGEIDGKRVIAESLTAPMEGGLPVKVHRASS
jgi:cytochrome P450